MKLKNNNRIRMICTDRSKIDHNRRYHSYLKITMKLLLSAFIIVSFMIIHSSTQKPRRAYLAALLTKTITKGEGYIRTDYYDSENILTFAIDAGYASKIVKDTKEGKIELFYDENGRPVEQIGNYYSILQIYDELGRNIKSIYLDINQKPTIISTGFSSIVRTFYENGMTRTEKYYDQNGNPIWTNGYGYGRLIEYDENGFIHKITYMNKKDEIVSNGLGYAIVIRQYYPADSIHFGRIEYEFYYDEHEKPISRSLGQYGVHKEYDDNGYEIKTTYLDKKGKPLITTKGYTSIIRTYHKDGSIATEQYFDSNEKPVQLAGGQFGVRNEDGLTFFLDENGNDKFSIKQLLYNHSELVIVFALLIIIISLNSSKRMNGFIFIAYLGIIGYMTLLHRDNNGTQVNLDVLWSYRMFFSSTSVRSDILKNIWLFIPLGTVLYRIYPHSSILIVPIIVSMIIEIIQLLTGLGLCEIDDIISNSLGGSIGYVLGRNCKLFIQQQKEKWSKGIETNTLH